jgi:hypothetical protein
MLTPTVTEVRRALEPVTEDPFIDRQEGLQVSSQPVASMHPRERPSGKARRRRAWLPRQLGRRMRPHAGVRQGAIESAGA